MWVSTSFLLKTLWKRKFITGRFSKSTWLTKSYKILHSNSCLSSNRCMTFCRCLLSKNNTRLTAPKKGLKIHHSMGSLDRRNRNLRFCKRTTWKKLKSTSTSPSKLKLYSLIWTTKIKTLLKTKPIKTLSHLFSQKTQILRFQRTTTTRTPLPNLTQR